MIRKDDAPPACPAADDLRAALPIIEPPARAAAYRRERATAPGYARRARPVEDHHG